MLQIVMDYYVTHNYTVAQYSATARRRRWRFM